MDYQKIPYRIAERWYPWSNKSPAGRQIGDNMRASICAAIAAARAGRPPPDYLLTRPAKCQPLLTHLIGKQPATSLQRLGSFCKPMADIVFWSGTPLSFLARILIFTDEERWPEALADIGLYDAERCCETANDCVARIGRAVEPHLSQMARILSDQGQAYHVRRYDEMPTSVCPDGIVLYLQSNCLWARRVWHERLLHALCSEAHEPSVAMAVLGYESDLVIRRRRFAPTVEPASAPFDGAVAPFDDKGLRLLQCLKENADTAAPPFNMCQVYINVMVPSHTHPNLVDFKLGKCDHGGQSRLDDAHAAHYTNLIDVYVRVPAWFTDKCEKLYPVHFQGARRSETVERFFHGLLDAFNLRHRAPDVMQKEHFCVTRETLRTTISVLSTFPGVQRVCNRSDAVEKRYPSFWKDTKDTNEA